MQIYMQCMHTERRQSHSAGAWLWLHYEWINVEKRYESHMGNVGVAEAEFFDFERPHNKTSVDITSSEM